MLQQSWSTPSGHKNTVFCCQLVVFPSAGHKIALFCCQLVVYLLLFYFNKTNRTRTNQPISQSISPIQHSLQNTHLQQYGEFLVCKSATKIIAKHYYLAFYQKRVRS